MNTYLPVLPAYGRIRIPTTLPYRHPVEDPHFFDLDSSKGPIPKLPTPSFQNSLSGMFSNGLSVELPLHLRLIPGFNTRPFEIFKPLEPTKGMEELPNFLKNEPHPQPLPEFPHHGSPFEESTFGELPGRGGKLALEWDFWKPLVLRPEFLGSYSGSLDSGKFNFGGGITAGFRWP